MEGFFLTAINGFDIWCFLRFNSGFHGISGLVS